MRKLLFCFVLFSLTGCATTPQSRGEFKRWTKEHTTLALHESYIVDRRFEDVTASLKKKWLQCYSNTLTTTRTSGGMTTSRYSDTHHPRFRNVNDSLFEMTLQVTTEGMIMLSKVPEGGDYSVAIDVHRLPKNKTKVTWHSYTWGGWTAAWERNRKWSDGQDAPCGK